MRVYRTHGEHTGETQIHQEQRQMLLTGSMAMTTGSQGLGTRPVLHRGGRVRVRVCVFNGPNIASEKQIIV